MTTTRPNGVPQTVDARTNSHPLRRGLVILDVLAAEPERYLGVNEIARLVDMHKSTVSRLSAELHDAGYIEREAATGKLRLGPRIYQMAGVGTPQVDIRAAARPILQSLVDAVGDSAHVAALQGDDLVTIDLIEGPHRVRVRTRIGGRHVFHASSLGLAVLSILPRDQVDHYLGRGPLQPVTEFTVTDRKELYRQLEIFRQQGYSVDFEGIEEGLRCVGAPVRGQSGDAVGAISVSAPRHRLPEERIPELARAVSDAAAKISQRLGGATRGKAPEPAADQAAGTRKRGRKSSAQSTANE